MTDIRFYHLQRQTLDQVLPLLLAKALTTDKKITVRTPDPEERERLNAHLWTWNPDSFLPHGSEKNKHHDKQPIWLTSANDNPAQADILMLTGNVTPENDVLGSYEICCDLFDGRDPEAVKAARARWKIWKEAGHDVTYYQQNDKGAWEKKA